jgi:hypothetical protein
MPKYLKNMPTLLCIEEMEDPEEVLETHQRNPRRYPV